MVLEQLDNTMGENVDHYLTAHEKINSTVYRFKCENNFKWEHLEGNFGENFMIPVQTKANPKSITINKRNLNYIIVK